MGTVRSLTSDPGLTQCCARLPKATEHKGGGRTTTRSGFAAGSNGNHPHDSCRAIRDSKPSARRGRFLPSLSPTSLASPACGQTTITPVVKAPGRRGPRLSIAAAGLLPARIRPELNPAEGCVVQPAQSHGQSRLPHRSAPLSGRKTSPKRMQYHPSVINGFLAATALRRPSSPRP